MASCEHRHPCDPPPGIGCGCGIHALRERRAVLADIENVVPPVVVGSVSLWGRVIPAERGYRAQFAYPLGLVILRKSWLDNRALARELAGYRVPTVIAALGDLLRG